MLVRVIDDHADDRQLDCPIRRLNSEAVAEAKAEALCKRVGDDQPPAVRRLPVHLRRPASDRRRSRRDPAMAGPRRDSRAFTVVVIVLVCLGALPMLLIIALSSAPAIAVLATVLAAVPVVPLVLCYLWLDRYEPEPRRLLLMGLLWGAFAATFGALVVQGIGGLFAGVTDDVSLAVLAPVTEEASKGLFLFLLLWWRRPSSTASSTASSTPGMLGIGFAFTENILYLGASYNGTDGMGPAGWSV